MTTNTDVHTCSYYCERPGCIRAQRDELVARLTAATAAQDAENERLRAEVEKVTCELMDAITRAERLAEALREWWSAHRPVGWTEDQHRARPYVNLITVADKALTEALLRDQEARND